MGGPDPTGLCHCHRNGRQKAVSLWHAVQRSKKNNLPLVLRRRPGDSHEVRPRVHHWPRAMCWAHFAGGLQGQRRAARRSSTLRLRCVYSPGGTAVGWAVCRHEPVVEGIVKEQGQQTVRSIFATSLARRWASQTRFVGELRRRRLLVDSHQPLSGAVSRRLWHSAVRTPLAECSRSAAEHVLLASWLTPACEVRCALGYGEAAASKWTKGHCVVRKDGKAGTGMVGGGAWTKRLVHVVGFKGFE